MIAAFSPAISATVSPSTAMWSSETGVITLASVVRTTLVASHRPPRPVSSTTISHCCSAKYRKASAVVNSNSPMDSPSGRARLSHATATRSARRVRSASGIIAPSTRMRS